MQHHRLKSSVVFCILLLSGTASANAADKNSRVCTAVQQFAVDVAKRMQAGTGAKEEFDMHGGLDAISKGMLNIINYVHTHRVNKGIAPARIGSLTLARCQNGAFGKLEYSDLPEEYDPDYQQENGFERYPDAFLPAEQSAPMETPAIDSTDDQDSVAANPACLQYRQRIRQLDEQMRTGYSSEAGDQLREQRRQYRELANKNCS
ncbi:MAG TPA: hypothetical protein VGL10_06990 [Gammaproteobacteria bacterium]